MVEGGAVLLAAGLLLHHADSLFNIRCVFVGSSEIDVGFPGHPFDHWFKWRKFSIRMDCCDQKYVTDVEYEQFFEILEDMFLGPAR